LIKSINLVNDKLFDISLQNIEYIVGFHLNFQNKSYKDNCLLDIDFIVKENGKHYIASLRFHNPTSINFESGGIFQQMSIGVYDIRDRGWGNRHYEVIDYEDDTLHFYCSYI